MRGQLSRNTMLRFAAVVLPAPISDLPYSQSAIALAFRVPLQEKPFLDALPKERPW